VGLSVLSSLGISRLSGSITPSTVGITIDEFPTRPSGSAAKRLQAGTVPIISTRFNYLPAGRSRRGQAQYQDQRLEFITELSTIFWWEAHQ
jgi:hypothetical protein